MQPQQSSKERRPLSKRPLKKKLEGKTFYLDNVKKQPLILLSQTIHALGGRVESFLHKDVDYVVTGTKEDLKQENPAATRGALKDEAEGDKRQTVPLQRGLAGAKRPGTPRPVACGSRGKALLEKAIRNNERLQASSVLSNARSWGVKILSVDHALLYLKKLTKERCQAKQCPVMKATVLNVPHLKIEDVSRKYKPLFTLYATFPALCHLSKNPPLQSPPPPPWFEHWAERGEHKAREKKAESSKFQTSLNLPWLIGKKNTSYCECCVQTFTSLKEHLESDQHHRFAMDRLNYSAVDQVVAEMFPVFDSAAFHQSEEVDRPPPPLPVDDFCDVELHIDESQQDFFLNTLRPRASPVQPKQEEVAAEMNPFTPQTPSQLTVNPPPALNVQASPSRQPQRSPSSSALPPVLSPEIPFPCFHSSYSDLPVLSPQQYTAEERACEMNFFDVMSEFIAVFTAPSSCANGGSPSVPPAATPNPKKRRRSASEQSSKRRRRRTLSGCTSTSAGRVPEAARRQSDIKREFEEASPRRTGSDRTRDTLDAQRTPSTSPHNQIGALASPSPRPPPSAAGINPPLDFTSSEVQGLLQGHHDSERSLSHAASVSIERCLIPDPAALSPPSSSNSEWDCGLLSRLGPPPATCPAPAGPSCELDKELLHRPCPWTYDRGYESHLHTILQQVAPCGDEKDVASFSRSVAQTAEVQ